MCIHTGARVTFLKANPPMSLLCLKAYSSSSHLFPTEDSTGTQMPGKTLSPSDPESVVFTPTKHHWTPASVFIDNHPLTILRHMVCGTLIASKSPILCPSLESQAMPYHFGVPPTKVVLFTFPLLESQRAL